MIAFGLDKDINYNFVNEFSQEKIFLNKFMNLSTEFIQANSSIITLNDSDEYRPDIIAYDFYGDDLYYPCILAANSIGSIFSFKPDRLNYECYVPNEGFVKNYMDTVTS